MFGNYICALDIGSSKIAACLVQIHRRQITSLFFESILSRGIKRGAVIDSMELSGCLGNILKKLKSQSGINVKYVYIAISGQDIITKHSQAVIPLTERGNKVITHADIQNVNEQARILGASLEEEIIHQVPLSYTIDSKANILNPLGLYSHRLEVDLLLICSRLSSLQSFSRVINQAGYEIKDLFFAGLVTSQVIFSKEFKKGINIVCDLGSDITELLVFKDGILKHIDLLSLGGDDFTKGLAQTLEIPFDLAEDVKRSHGIVGNYHPIKPDEEILVKQINVYKPIKQKLVAAVMTSKAKSVCQSIKDTIEKITPCAQVNNFVATGRTVLIEGFLETLENILGVSVKLGRITDTHLTSLVSKESNLSGHNYLNYLTALGIVSEALSDLQHKGLSISKPTHNLFLRGTNRLKEIYQEYF